MELRYYWRIFLRRWWIAAAITLATAIISFLMSPLTQGTYTASLRVLMGMQAEPGQGYYRYNGYYGILSSEYLTDDFIEVVRSQSFRDKVVQEMRPPPQGALTVSAPPRSERAPRIVTINVSASNEEEAHRGGEAAGRVATARIGEYFPQMGANGATAILIDPPAVTQPGIAGRNYVNILLRTLAGFMVGLGLVFLLHYLDNRLYDAADVERHLGIPVLAEVPKENGRP